MLILSPSPNSIPVPSNQNLEYFALTYGKRGVIMCVRDRSKALMEVKQLQRWSTEYSPISAHWEGWGNVIIPEAERIQYLRAIERDAQVHRAYIDGGNYNIPIGLKRWVETYEPEYQELGKLKVFDYY